jgi:para-aminobenzoate synthetase/4-amino-4-deoxychorismate lyase
MSPAFALLDATGGGAWLFENHTQTLSVFAATDLAAQCCEIESLTASGAHVVAALNYELGHVFEPSSAPVPDGVLGYFLVFSDRHFLPADALTAHMQVLAGNPPRPAAVADFVPTIAAGEHADAVARIRDYIAVGDCYQVNFTFPFSGQCLGDPVALYARLRAAQPVAHGGLVMTPEVCVLSLSPELFVERQGGVIRSRPMKGTAARGGHAGDDAAARAALAASVKDRAENVMIVDLIRSDLGRIAEPGSVRVEAICAVEDYPSVFQMTSTVSARSAAGLYEVLAALFPCGSITGAPKVRAMQIIHELEQQPRGLYTGALGWIGAQGDFCLSVAIRTLQIEQGGRVRYGVGSGIVWDSAPAAEYAECLLKAGFVASADPGFRLIETLRLAAGTFPMLALHLERLQGSASALSFACDRAALTKSLEKLAAENPQGDFRVRMTLGRAGDVVLAATPLVATAEGAKTVFSPARLDSRNPWLRYKTTVRDLYEQELARIQNDPAVFDVIFFNERNEVCEGARSNVFVRMAQGEPLLTPPLVCGLLPGVLRRHLLESGAAREAVLGEADVRRAAEVYLGNALRGLIRVSLSRFEN